MYSIEHSLPNLQVPSKYRIWHQNLKATFFRDWIGAVSASADNTCSVANETPRFGTQLGKEIFELTGPLVLLDDALFPPKAGTSAYTQGNYKRRLRG